MVRPRQVTDATILAVATEREAIALGGSSLEKSLNVSASAATKASRRSR